MVTYFFAPHPNQLEPELLFLRLPLLRADHVPAKPSQDRQLFFIEPAHELGRFIAAQSMLLLLFSEW